MAAPDQDVVVVVGAGLAGWTVLKELRRRQPQRQLVLVTADAGDFYSKPVLSNAHALGKAPDQLVQHAGPAQASQLGVTLLAHTQVLRIDRERQVLVVEGPGGPAEQPYGALVLAVGAAPIRLPLQGDAAAVHAVNHLTDYATWRQALETQTKPGDAVAVLGAGLIGVEFADDLLRAGLVPHVFDLATQPLGRLLPLEPAVHLRDRLQAAGVVWHLGDPVVAVQRQDTGLQLTTHLGEVVVVQAALSAVGLRPQTALAQAAGLVVARGIVVDAALRTNDPAIYAVGDCAAYPSPSGPSPLPFVLPLMTAARTLAAVLAGESAELQFPVMPVVVKTPSCPLVVAPPPIGSDGSWQSESLWTEVPGAAPVLGGTRSLFRSPDGPLTGFALSGVATSERQQWQKQLQAALAG